MPTALPDQRAVVGVSGPEARAFMDRLVTCDVGPVAPGRAAFGALLTPQGKIVADFVIQATSDEEFLLDASALCVAELVKRLSMYRLRAKLAIADRSGELAVAAGWDGAPRPADALAVADDPRLPALGWRAVVAGAPAVDATPAVYAAHRIALGVPEGGADFPFGDAFPHEADMDGLGGVDFGKGCYVGQEVVSRMQHRGTARTRIVPLAFEDGADAPPAGADVTAGGRALGRMGSSAGSRGLASLRLDRAADALAAGVAIAVEGRPARLLKPDWARFAMPGEPGLAAS